MYKIQLLFISALFLVSNVRLNAGRKSVIDNFPLHKAASIDNGDRLITLIDQCKYDVDEIEYPTGETALYKTTIYNCPHTAYALLVRGASIGYKKKLGSLEYLETPTYSAVDHNNLVVLALLWYFCGDDDFFDAPSKITGLRPSVLAQEKKSSLAELIQKGEQALLEFYENNPRGLKASMEEARKLRLQALEEKKKKEWKEISDYRIGLKKRSPRRSLWTL